MSALRMGLQGALEVPSLVEQEAGQRTKDVQGAAQVSGGGGGGGSLRPVEKGLREGSSISESGRRCVWQEPAASGPRA